MTLLDLVLIERFDRRLTDLPDRLSCNVSGHRGAGAELCTDEDADALRLMLVGAPSGVEQICGRALP
ncbi:MAG: hypothetical protein P8Q97_08440 [Myxococcota bacterium]|nr:hypothetical protein [Myxococcota bacterium]